MISSIVISVKVKRKYHARVRDVDKACMNFEMYITA